MNKDAMKQMQAKGRQTNQISQAVNQAHNDDADESEDEDEEEQMRRVMEESKKSAEIEETKRRLADDAARLEEAK